VVLVLAVAGWRSSVTLIVFTVIGVCAVLAGGYWFLANRGVLRWLALVLVVAAPVLIVVAFAWQHLVWVAVVAVALMLCAAAVARIALRTDGGTRACLQSQAGWRVTFARACQGLVATQSDGLVTSSDFRVRTLWRPMPWLAPVPRFPLRGRAGSRG
jgi:hypothetical protein